MSKLPDGPKTPRLLQKIQWITDPLGYLDAAAQRYGDIFKVSVVGNEDSLLVSNPQALKQIFTSDTKQFTAPKVSLAQPHIRGLLSDYARRLTPSA